MDRNHVAHCEAPLGGIYLGSAHAGSPEVGHYYCRRAQADEYMNVLSNLYLGALRWQLRNDLVSGILLVVKPVLHLDLQPQACGEAAGALQRLANQVRYGDLVAPQHHAYGGDCTDQRCRQQHAEEQEEAEKRTNPSAQAHYQKPSAVSRQQERLSVLQS